LLQNPDTAETSLKEILPPLQQTIMIHTERDLLEYGVQDTSAESIPHSSSKNKVLTPWLATLTQFFAQLRCETGIPGRNFVTIGVQLFQAGLSLCKVSFLILWFAG